MRRLNYTKRQRINRKDIAILLQDQQEEPFTFEAILELSSYSLPPDSRVFIEAYQNPKFERFEMGTVSSPVLAPIEITRFGRHEAFNFRIKVVDSGDNIGCILAMASRIRPTESGDAHQSSLLPVSVQPLDDVVYRVAFGEDGPPTLVLNQALDSIDEDGIKAMATSPMFVSLVYPSVVREVLTKVLIIDGNISEGDEEDGTVSKWKKFARRFNAEEIPNLDEEEDASRLEEWIDVVVAKFSKTLDVVRKFELTVRG